MLLTDVGTLSRAGVYGDDDAALEPEGEGGGSVLDLDLARRVTHIISVELKE